MAPATALQQSKTEKVSKKVKPLRGFGAGAGLQVPLFEASRDGGGEGTERERENGVGMGDQATDSLLELLALGTWCPPRTSVFNLLK